MKIIDHEFVEFIPEHEDMEDGVIYISLDYDTAVHNCVCGCDQQVVTPLSPTDWKLTYNGESVSLYPSIGNWEFDCKSHYWVKEGEVIWAERWSEQRVHSGREADQKTKSHHFEQKNDENREKLFHKFKTFLVTLFKEQN
tara:strand:+ start:24665 stop:25084 length:420 start_codon:yes stop_codon:yes gene_type:complete